MTGLRLLGVPALSGASGLQPLTPSTPTSLLLYLAIARDWVSRHELAYLYRPDDTESAALTYLRLQLHRAQRYQWAATLEVEKHQVRWLVDTDVAALRDAHAARRWDEVVSLSGGSLLTGHELDGCPTYDSWLDIERQSVDELVRDALEREAERLTSAGELDEAAEHVRRLLRLDPWDEESHRRYLSLLARQGTKAKALAHFQRFATDLEAEFGEEPTQETLALVARIEADELPVAESAPPAATNLPSPTTRFVGRQRELREIGELLATPECRLVTLSGMGGTGKTRLAIEAARGRVGEHRSGVWFVSLAAVSDAVQAVPAIATTLGIELEGRGDAVSQLITALDGSDALLVLDNVEQVNGLGELATRLLAEVQGLMLLATSRSALRLTSEWLYEVRGLDLVPDVGDARGASDAVRLFVGAALRVAPGTDFSDEDLAHAARICAQVEGLPLAIELAASWLRAMTPDQVATEIAAGFELLTTDLADLPVRHRSLEAVLDKTWEDLTDVKLHTLQRLSVFVGGCTLEAARAVSGSHLSTLLSLVNQSLLQRRDDGRLYCHALVQQYARRRLAGDAEAERAALDAHARHYAAWIDAFDTADRDATELYKRLEPDMGNALSAWEHLLATAGFDTLDAMNRTFLNYFNVLGHYRQGVDVCARAVAALRTAGAPTELTCTVQLAGAAMAREGGDLATAATMCLEAGDMAEQGGHDELAARARQYLGDVRQMGGDYDAAAALYAEASAAFERHGNLAETANTLNSLASLETMQERYDLAKPRFERCVTLFERVGDHMSRAIALNNLAYIADVEGEYGAAATLYEKSLAEFERLGFQRGIAAIKNNLVVLYGMTGRYEEAESSGRESLALKHAMNDTAGSVITLKNLGDLRLRRGDHAASLEYYAPAIIIAIDHGATPRLIQVLTGYAEALIGIGATDLAASVANALYLHPVSPPSVRSKAAQLYESTTGGGQPLPDERDEEPLTALLPALLAHCNATATAP